MTYRCSSSFFSYNVYLFIILYIFVHVAKCKDEEKSSFMLVAKQGKPFDLEANIFQFPFYSSSSSFLSSSTSSFYLFPLPPFNKIFFPGSFYITFLFRSSQTHYVSVSTTLTTSSWRHTGSFGIAHIHTQQNHFVTIMRFLSSIVIIIIEITRTMHTITVG